MNHAHFVGKRYEHWKGNRYRIVAIAKDSETLETLVVYQGEYGERPVYVRPLAMFFEEIERDGRRFPRFRELDEKRS